MPAQISSFKGDYQFLSNFWSVQVMLDGIWYASVEHAYQAAKTSNPEARKLFTEPDCSFGDAKRMGQNLSIRPDWDDVKLFIMENLVRQKFADPIMGFHLIQTAQAELIEGNWWHDQFWGNCVCPKHIAIPGENHLGKILMKVRDGIRLV